MKKYLLILILIVLITAYFFIFNNKSSNNHIEKIDTNINKDEQTIENKKVDLIDNFINTKINLPKKYEEKENYDKPTSNITNKISKEKNDTKLDVNVDINKETKEFEKLQFKIDKNF